MAQAIASARLGPAVAIVRPPGNAIGKRPPLSVNTAVGAIASDPAGLAKARREAR